MVIQFSGGKIIVTPHEVVVRLGHEMPRYLASPSGGHHANGKGGKCDDRQWQ